MFICKKKTFACDLKPMICLQYVVITTVFVNTTLNKSKGVQMSKVQWQIESLGVCLQHSLLFINKVMYNSMTSFVPIWQMKMESKR